MGVRAAPPSRGGRVPCGRKRVRSISSMVGTTCGMSAPIPRRGSLAATGLTITRRSIPCDAVRSCSVMRRTTLSFTGTSETETMMSALSRCETPLMVRLSRSASRTESAATTM
jgi:hypothetical protein